MPSKSSAKAAVADKWLQKVIEHPESIEVKIGPSTYQFLLNGRGSRLTREAGHDPVEAIFKTIAALAPAMQEAGLIDEQQQPRKGGMSVAKLWMVVAQACRGEVFDAMCVVIWWGVITAHPETDLEDIECDLTPATLVKVGPAIWAKMVSYAKDITDDDRARDASGKRGGKAGN